GEAVLMVMSGNVFGFGVMSTPLMLTTLAEGEPAVGSRRGKGLDCPPVPWTEPENGMLYPSRRI
ncbi:MAG TPA: hypothetical protein VN985_02295, partial [Candidatus Eisenbacteria bacterium]|nr:hypothetical protein [Candidatus Eisenbacteria bacterium]